VAAFVAAQWFSLRVAAAIGADVFFAVFVAWSLWLVVTLTAGDLRRKADIEDEGAAIVTLLTLASIAYAVIAIFVALSDKAHAQTLELVLTMAGAPLGWLMLQMVMAFHYAQIFYSGDEKPGYVPPVDFGKCPEPGPWEFVYMAMTVGMTAQVSDTNVQTTPMRRAITAHAVVSFFFNTVLIALAVNAAVSK
jgi:uncharacterized membrane protein